MSTYNVSNRDYVAKLKELDLDDPNFEEKFNQINKSYSSKTHSYSSKTHLEHHDILRHRIDPFYSFFGNPFRELTQMHDTINNMMNKFKNQNIFIKDGEFDEDKLDKLNLNTEINTDNITDNNTDKKQERSYYKYVSSMTTYDNNGIRKAKSISRSEKYDGKNKKVTQVSRYQDGDKYVEEYLQPDGSIKKIEKTVNRNLDL